MRCVFGLDEAGRGAWAGPVTAGAVCLPADPAIAALLVGVNDSKQLSARRRAALIDLITAHALTWGVGMVDADVIDQIGIVAATCEAMRRALAAAHDRQPGVIPDHLLIDSIKCPAFGVPHDALIRGDSRSLSIAAASILAKVTRDRAMIEYGQQYPLYGFGVHKGYGTALHQHMIREHGISPLHRRTFQPMRGLLAQERLL